MILDEWRDIPDFDGMYQINQEGDVRSWRKPSGGRLDKPRMLKPYIARSPSMRSKGVRYVYLTNSEGYGRPYKVLSLMIRAWLGKAPEGMIPFHKNGDLGDTSINNIAFTTPKKLGKKTGGKNSARMPVSKVDKNGKIVEIYKSIGEAARRNHMAESMVRARCHNRVKDPYALDGYNYQFEK